MSICSMVYIVGSVIAVVLALRWCLCDVYDDDVTVGHLLPLAFAAFLAACLSWMLVLIMLVCKYEDKVIIKRKKD